MSQYGDAIAASRARFLQNRAKADLGGNMAGLIPIPGPEQPPGGLRPPQLGNPGLHLGQLAPRRPRMDFRKLAILALLRSRQAQSRPGLGGQLGGQITPRLPGIPERPNTMQY